MSKLWLVVGGLVLVLVVVRITEAAPNVSCEHGRARGFAAIRSDPPYLVGDIPSHWTSSARFFTRRYNCVGRSVRARRVDLGTYDVMFPGQRPKLAIVTAISDSGVTASAKPFGAFVRIALRGPLVEGNVTERRDVPFSLVIY